MRKTIFFLFSFLILLCSSVYATDPAYTISNVVLSDNFDYSDAFSSHGWNYAGSNGDDRLKNPVPSHFLTNAYGFNATTGGSGLTSVIDFDTSTIFVTPVIVFNYSFNDPDDTFTLSLSNETIPVAGNSIAGFFQIEAGRSNVGTKNIVFGRTTQQITAGICNITFDTTLPQTHEVAVAFDFLNDNYDVIIDNELQSNCTNLQFLPDDSSWFIDDLHVNLRYGTQATTSYNFSIDNLIMGEGGTVATGSPVDAYNCNNLVAPLVYCDLFNYNTALFSTNEWYVFTGSGSIDTSLSPINNQMNMTDQTRILSPKHFIQPFKVDYVLDNSNTINKAPYSPVMSVEYDLKVLPTTEGKGLSVEDASTHLIARDEKNRDVFDLLFHSEAGDQTIIYYRNSTGSLNQLCDNCNLVENVSTNVKVSVFFSQKEEFNSIFNSSNSVDKIELYVNNTLIADNITFRHEQAHNFDNVQFEHKTDSGAFVIDDYFVYTGIDKDNPTAQLFYKSIKQVNIEHNTTRLTTGSGDVLTDVGAMWWELGLRTTGSRVFFGLSVIVLINLAMFGLMVSKRADPHPSIFMIITILMLIFEVVAQLLPVWIPIVLALIGAGAGAFAFREKLGFT